MYEYLHNDTMPVFELAANIVKNMLIYIKYFLNFIQIVKNYLHYCKSCVSIV